MSIIDGLWLEKYRPRRLEDVILPEDIIKSVSGAPMNHLFSGSQGSGKTTLARVLANIYTQGDKNAQLYINVSETSGVDTVRNTISDFCSTVSLGASAIKVVILDEVDYMSSAAQAAMRGQIEKFAGIAYFIATCNYPDRLIDALRKSRFHETKFAFDTDTQSQLMLRCMDRLVFILKDNGCTIEQDAIVHLIKKYWPDYRAMLQILYFAYVAGTRNITIDDVIKHSAAEHGELYNFIATNKDPREHYKYMQQYKGRELDIIASLSSNFVDWCYEQQQLAKLKNCMLGDICIVAHKYGVESKQSIDNFITLLALSNELSKYIQA
jgi:DNA polymerase III delta prime subunit